MIAEKAQRRLNRFYSLVANRREFILAAAAVGLTISKPEDVVAEGVTRDQAIILAYSAFWGGAGGSVEAEGTATPKDIEGDRRFKKYNKNASKPNDGHDGQNGMGKPHQIKHDDNEGPGLKNGGKAREWLLWRVTPSFESIIGNWDSEGPYVLANCARMGVVAMRIAQNTEGLDVVQWDHAFKAYYAVRDNPVKVPMIRAQWCD